MEGSFSLTTINDGTTFPKRFAAAEFKKLGDKVRGLVSERQLVYIRWEKVGKDIAAREEGTGLEALLKMAGMAPPSLTFLESESEWDPNKVIEKMTAFQNMLEENLYYFIRSPIGPLYACVEVTSNMWCKLVEKILSPYLFTYIVDNLHDQDVLEGLVTKFKSSMNLVDELEDPCQITVVVSNFSCSYVAPPPNKILERLSFYSEKLMNVLKFKEEENRVDVWKQFIGKTLEGEHSYLFQSEHDAFIFMHAQKSANFPVITLAYSLDGYQIYPFPEFKTSTFRIPKKASFLQVDKGDEINYLKAKQKELQRCLYRFDRAIFNAREQQFRALEDYESFDTNQNKVDNTEGATSKDVTSFDPIGDGEESCL